MLENINLSVLHAHDVFIIRKFFGQELHEIGSQEKQYYPYKDLHYAHVLFGSRVLFIEIH